VYAGTPAFVLEKHGHLRATQGVSRLSK
jgi:hypothetical protein